MTFKKARNIDAKLRLALCAPAGGGKTWTALEIATGLAGDKRVAYVDTEHGSASKYADVFDFDCIEPDTFDPKELIQTIDRAVEEGYAVICIDSLSHYWAGPGGELEMVDAASARTKGNSFAAWKTVTPVHNQLVDKILSAKIHIIVTMRTKTEWVIDEVNGKKQPRKIGLAPIMRDGIEFEFDVCGEMDQENVLTITKSRCPALSGKVIRKPGQDVVAVLRDWLSGDAAPETPAPQPPPPPSQPTTTAVEHAVSSPAKGTAAAIDKPWESFKGMLECFAKVKAEIGDNAYYTVLSQFGLKHANQFRDADKALDCFRAMTVKRQVDAG